MPSSPGECNEAIISTSAAPFQVGDLPLPLDRKSTTASVESGTAPAKSPCGRWGFTLRGDWLGLAAFSESPTIRFLGMCPERVIRTGGCYFRLYWSGFRSTRQVLISSDDVILVIDVERFLPFTPRNSRNS